ncbi:hypothetical protein G6F70_002488 [Rhizopus microsporus]|uniref:Uncharacterized protein n=2 Tax=Rhizopus TaxID=4842 RepID=A0A367IUT5_RHIAZ|nr:hypothetical protein G6F71_002585 [Rhizopus microsporus]RCH81453.1 hypothetical protein CU097_001818 [Rhizopus azygosporus]KAG1202181.1 hypothetical protein G6F70_002488 [Rhizopus microsporus]KAG1216251.1 hypothetical protein G6F69_000306 [Rhizopus microsporus]KAG1236676.1 hypothetical protein G6F67_001798 [Rhizopus microsporus]
MNTVDLLETIANLRLEKDQLLKEKEEREHEIEMLEDMNKKLVHLLGVKSEGGIDLETIQAELRKRDEYIEELKETVTKMQQENTLLLKKNEQMPLGYENQINKLTEQNKEKDKKMAALEDRYKDLKRTFRFVREQLKLKEKEVKEWNEHKALGCFADLNSVQDMMNNLDDLLIQKREYAAAIDSQKQAFKAVVEEFTKMTIWHETELRLERQGRY